VIQVQPPAFTAPIGPALEASQIFPDNRNSAITDSCKALELDPTMVNAYLNRGLGQLLQGKDNEAWRISIALILKPEIKDELSRRIKKAEAIRATMH
jgi:hypothetical protein